MTAQNQVARELAAGVGVVVAIHLLTALVAVTLLGRMAPAIERILRENVPSTEAVEVMLESLASAPAGAQAPPAVPARFRQALQRAQRNVTEPEERPQLDIIHVHAAAAFRGDPGARPHVLAALRELGDINRSAMRRANDEARRLGTAGAWAVVFLALVGFAVSTIALRRIRRRVFEPLGEIQRTLNAYRLGDTHRRCAAAGASEETRHMMDDLNDVLDEITAARPSRELDIGRMAGGGTIREALLWMLDREAKPVVVLAEDGKLVAASQRALDRLASDDGVALRDRLADVVNDATAAGAAAGVEVLGRAGNARLVALPP